MVNKTVYFTTLSSRAQKEIEKAWEWYEERQQGPGDRFVKEIKISILKIEKTPNRYPSRYNSYKEAIVAVFPFIIIYKISKKKIIRIVSVFHTSLNPKRKYG